MGCAEAGRRGTHTRGSIVCERRCKRERMGLGHVNTCRVDAGRARHYYVHNTTGKIQNVYMQPLNGGPPVQLTHFNSEPAIMVGYGWSRDGKKFAITRARYDDTDVVMFSNFR